MIVLGFIFFLIDSLERVSVIKIGLIQFLILSLL